MLELADSNVHPAPLDTDASVEGSSSLLLLEVRVIDLHFGSEEQRGLGFQQPFPLYTRNPCHLAIASPRRFLFFSSPPAHIVMAFDGVDRAGDTRYWRCQWSYR